MKKTSRLRVERRASTRVDETPSSPLHGAAPGMKSDDGKLPYHLFDDDAEAEVAAVLAFGAVKYEPGNWVLVEDARDRYYSAARRHLRAFRRGEVLDPEHGLLALASAACNVHFLLAMELRAHPDLADSLPGRLKVALSRARALREERLRRAAAKKDRRA